MQGRFKREGSAGDAEPSDASDRETPGSPAPGAADRGRRGTRRTPGPSRAPRRPADLPSAARPGAGGGSRLALRNWRISTRLVSLIALPVAAATVLGVLRIQNSLDNVEQLENMQVLTDMAQQATLLGSALQEERDRSAGPLVSGRGPAGDEVASAREDTDEAVQAFDDALDASREDQDLAGIEATVIDIRRRLGELSDIRDEAYSDPAYFSQTVTRYSGLIDALQRLSQDLAQATSNSDMIRSTRALMAFSSAKEHASIQRALITAGLARAERPGEEAALSESDWRFGGTHQRSEDSELDGFVEVYGDEDGARRLLDRLRGGGDANIVAADQYATQVFGAPDGMSQNPRSYRDWYDEDRTKIDAMHVIERTLLDEMEQQARSLRDDAQRDAFLNGALVLLVLGVSVVGAFVVARSMIRSLRRLQDTAQEVARERLPEVVRHMSEAEPEDVDTTVEPVGVYTRDEIGQVAQAFDDVHREAVRLAGEQALLRGNVNAMFTNLSRRSQGLIQRQLSLISELESREADPDQLSSLFKLDHLATRMRRNGENLLVLAGEEPGRRWTRPVPLVDVLRAAASEVEQYERIELSAVPKSEVVGRVVNDLVHLLAELLENATSFSSPQTKVKVTGHALPDGRVLVEIHDTGIGLSPEDLAEINDRLANPPTVDVSVSRRMGLFVVGRLSLRHNIRIQLRPSDSGGTTALVMLPADVAQGAARTRPGAPAGDPGRGPEPGRPRPAAPLAPGRGEGPRPPHPRDEAAPARAAGEAERPGERPAASPAWGSAPGAAPRAGERPGGGPALPVRSGPSRPPAPRPQPTRPQPVSGQGPGAPAPGAQGRPALPSRPVGGTRPPLPGGGAPSGAEPPAPPLAAGGSRPSWAGAAEDSGALPVVDPGAGPGPGGRTAREDAFLPAPPGPGAPGAPGPDRAEEDRPRGHDETGPAEHPLPAEEPPAPAALPAAAGSPGERPGPYDGQPAPQRPEDTGAFAAFGAPPAALDELSGPLPEGALPGADERTPIFEEMESTWFGTRRAVPAPAPEEAGEPAPSARPEPAHAPAAHAPAHAAGPGADAPEAPWRPSPNDEQWRQAEQLRQPAAGGVTTAGLPRRVPRANLVAGAAQEPADAPGPLVSRSPDDVRGRLTNLRRGIQQGRQAGAATGADPDRGLGPSYQQQER
ncbi:nitrate- and nitrite sensing domain-containing protein [Streptomyces sp. DSM 44917]|uniref:histidine kinase n=1 Tax=Streptomyces boetiae TaxID=3075541 RepID=A0ABU2L9S7_9ACTN|nr:nitrate- and nitrite sensing domain-containing protein [Streptomyces sp. DSM 44917]MDT0308250.1 nitrate- and nitrite sensing domain-containing protein [Streptomyces sp. DSM 44917]